MDLNNEINYKLKELRLCLEKLRQTGSEYALAEKEYKITLRQEALKLRSEDMAITLIDKVVYGVPEVAEKRFQRDIAFSIYKANQEAINTIKLEIKIIEEQIKREYSNGD